MEPSCYQTLLQAAESLENATLWRQGIADSGLDLYLKDINATRGVLMVVLDEGLAGCNTSELYGTDWPYGVCATDASSWLQEFSLSSGQSLLMYHWIPNETLASVENSIEEGNATFSTLLGEAASSRATGGDAAVSMSDYQVTFPSPNTVALSESIESVASNELGLDLYPNASIIGRVEVCGDDGGGVYLLDRPLSLPSGTAVNATSLPQLNEYCDHSVLEILSTNEMTKSITLFGLDPSGFPSTSLSTILATSAFPVIPPLSSPMTNITVFTPNLNRDGVAFLEYAGSGGDATTEQFLEVLAALLLSHIVEGGYCPDDFKDGLALQTLAGEFSGKDYSLYVKQDESNPDQVNIQVLFGNNNDPKAKNFKAMYLGQACYSTVYFLESGIMLPWETPAIENLDGTVPYLSIADLPTVSSREDLFNPPGNDSTCINRLFIPREKSSVIPSNTSTSSSSSLSGGAIAGIVIGVVVAVMACAGIFAFWWKRQRRRNMEKSSETTIDVQTSSDKNIKDLPTSSSGNLITRDLSDILNYSDVDAETAIVVLNDSEVEFDIDQETGKRIKLGQGRFGKVYAGMLLGTQPVAIKCIMTEGMLKKPPNSEQHSDSGSQSNAPTSGSSTMNKESILREFRLLKSCHSQHIVSFIGIMFGDEEIRLVTELMAIDLWTALRNRLVTWYNGGLFIARDVAAGLKYLHEKKRVIHFDLKSSNILLQEASQLGRHEHMPDGYAIKFRAKVGDVGLSHFLPASQDYLNSIESSKGTWNWCAPEVILNEKCTSSVDMYSYGVVLWEIVTGEAPVRGRMRDVRVPEECPRVVSDLIKACLDPAIHGGKVLRPTASQAFKTLTDVMMGTGAT